MYLHAAPSSFIVLHKRLVPDFVPEFVSRSPLLKRETLHVPQILSVTSLRLSAFEKSGTSVSA